MTAKRCVRAAAVHRPVLKWVLTDRTGSATLGAEMTNHTGIIID